MLANVGRSRNLTVWCCAPRAQVFLEVACLPEDIRDSPDEPFPTTHQELDPTNMLSLIAALTPFSDYNQGPRIMYQCQMGKQTMGTPVHALEQRPDNKMYVAPESGRAAGHGGFPLPQPPSGLSCQACFLPSTTPTPAS